MEVPREFYASRMPELIRLVETIETKDEMWFMTFMKGKKQLTIQFKKSDNRTPKYFDTVEEIQNYIHLLEWSTNAPNWVYMNRRKDKSKSLRFMQKERRKDTSAVKEPPFARMIYETEIDYEEVGSILFRFGKWRGQEVDVYRINLDQDFGFLNRAMKSYRRLQGMNLSYDLLGHVLDEDCNIVGIMTEPMIGNWVTYRDRDIVMEAFDRLVEIGYILDFPHLGSMLITAKGEVRFTEMHNVMELDGSPEERRSRIERRRKMLDESFEALRTHHPEATRLPITRAKVSFPIRILVPRSDPAKLLRGTSGWMTSMAKCVFRDEKPRMKLIRSGGVKRLLDEDSDDEQSESSGDNCDTRRGQVKRIRTARSPDTRCWSERPLPRLPVARLDLPLLPPTPGEDGHSKTASTSRTPSFSAGAPSWLLEGPWLALAKTAVATTSRFEEVE